MLQAGFRDIIGLIPFESFGPILTIFIILILVSLLSGFIANTPIALIFLPIIEVLIVDFPFLEIPLLFAFIVAVNIGGNILPSGAAADMMTLKVAKDNGVENLGYRRLLKTGAAFTLIHIVSAMGFLFILIIFT
jgi:Na+/H+ antiporter NhaD/arsenite permease-like protein